MTLEYSAVLKDGFWPISRVSASFEDQLTKTGDVHEEFDDDHHFVEHAQDCLTESF